MASKSICLYFQVHQPTRLRLYRFFDIGKDSHYYDDFANRTILRRVAQKCYLPMNQLMLELIAKNKGKFKIAYSISGSALEQFQRFAPEVIDSFKALAATGKVEFLAETYYHSLASLASESEFRHQVEKHSALIEELFGVKPVTFRNTELIYSNGIGEMVYDMGYKTMLTEGARHIMGWQSPNYVYTGETQPKLKLLLRNYTLSDDIAFRFNQNKVTADQYVGWMKESAKEGDIVNLFMDYETFGEHQSVDTGIFEFMKALPAAVLKDGTFGFATPSEVAKKYKPVSDIAVDDPISWADEERDVTAWLGNELQSEAFKKVYAMTEKLAIVNDEDLYADWGHLQESDHFYYMCTKFFSDGEVHKYFNPYDTPYEAFINYMNVISDFQIRLDEKRAALDVKETAQKELKKAPKPVRKKVVKKK
jgi:alpha-amylase